MAVLVCDTIVTIHLRFVFNIRLLPARRRRGCRHNMGRALSEAGDINEWMNLPAALASRMLFRTASFCTE